MVGKSDRIENLIYHGNSIKFTSVINIEILFYLRAVRHVQLIITKVYMVIE